MEYLFYRYGNICEDDYITGFAALGLTVIEEKTEITNKTLLPSQQVALVKEQLDQHNVLFVFSVNYFPAIAEICHIYQIKYICHTVDCPVLELFSDTLAYDTNYVFLFDKAQYNKFAPVNPDHIFYLPLGCNTQRYDSVLASLSDTDRRLFSCDISFVGSLYNEKNPLTALSLSDYDRGYISGMIEANGQMPYANLLESLVTDELISHIKKADSSFYQAATRFDDVDRFVCAHSYIGMAAACEMRIQTLNTLAEHFHTTLFTRSNTAALKNVSVKPGIKTHTEMPKVFHLSKINLNMTIPPIQTGLPLRIFDIMGCGGFVMTNWQEEIPTIFTPGTDLETYTCLEELTEKCNYYLTHDDERIQIAQNGYQKVKSAYQYLHVTTAFIKAISQ